MRILVVEDDALVAKTLELLFADHNYAIDITTNGETAWQMAEAFEYDLILLDVLLPGLDGISLCQRLRDNDYQMPILLLTGQDDSHQKAVALNVGADDYVVKPFDPEELVARVQALLRRGSSVAQPVMEWGSLQLEPSIRRVTYEMHLLALTPKEYAILELFLRNSQRTLSPKTILGHAWNSIDNPGEETVRAHIKGLRQKLKAVGAPVDLIETVYGVGYRLKPLESLASPIQTDEPSQLSTTDAAPETGLSNQRSPKITQPTVIVVTGNSDLFSQIQALLLPKALQLIALKQPHEFWQKLENWHWFR